MVQERSGHVLVNLDESWCWFDLLGGWLIRELGDTCTLCLFVSWQRVTVIDKDADISTPGHNLLGCCPVYTLDHSWSSYKQKF